jgi:hypothetical protein
MAREDWCQDLCLCIWVLFSSLLFIHRLRGRTFDKVSVTIIQMLSEKCEILGGLEMELLVFISWAWNENLK